MKINYYDIRCLSHHLAQGFNKYSERNKMNSLPLWTHFPLVRPTYQLFWRRMERACAPRAEDLFKWFKTRQRRVILRREEGEKLQLHLFGWSSRCLGQKWVTGWKLSLKQNWTLHKEFVCCWYGKWQFEGTMLLRSHVLWYLIQ